MPPRGWQTCPHCNSAYSPSAFAKHEPRCKDRADVAAEHAALQELRKIEGPRPKALPDWPRCQNCGEPYGPHAIGPHTKRCVKLLPHGANGFGPQDHHKDPRFKHLYKAAQIDLGDAPTLAQSMGGALKSLGKSMASLLAALGPSVSAEELSRLRQLFTRFDANKDELLDRDEFGLLMRNGARSSPKQTSSAFPPRGLVCSFAPTAHPRSSAVRLPSWQPSPRGWRTPTRLWR